MYILYLSLIFSLNCLKISNEKKLKVYKKLSIFFINYNSCHYPVIIFFEGNKKSYIPKTSMIEVELKSSYQNTKKLPKIDNSETLKSIEINKLFKHPHFK